MKARQVTGGPLCFWELEVDSVGAGIGQRFVWVCAGDRFGWGGERIRQGALAEYLRCVRTRWPRSSTASLIGPVAQPPPISTRLSRVLGHPRSLGIADARWVSPKDVGVGAGFAMKPLLVIAIAIPSRAIPRRS